MGTSREGSAPALVLDAQGVSRRLGARAVLDDVTLTVPRGRVVALAGPNGAGKTTLMRVIAGRLAMDRGRIAVDGMAPLDARRRGRLGVVPQDIALYPHLTVRENLSVLGRLAGVPASALRRRVDDALAWSGLADRADAIARTLSGGMRRRVNLVAGALHHPALLLLDEPTVGVDAASEARLHALLRALRDQEVGILVATHNLDEAAVLCDEVAVMADGRIVASGPVEAIVAKAFAAGRELAVSVDAGHTEAAATVLDVEGFRRTGAHTWVRPASDRLGGLDELERRLREAGVRVAEARLREPSLRGAIAVLTGSAAATAGAGDGT